MAKGITNDRLSALVTPRQPIWERLGFENRNQYRNAQAAKLTNPDTGLPFTSYRQFRDARARELGRPRDYQEERFRADLRARRQGFTSARDRQAKNRQRAAALQRPKAEAFAAWGITESGFNRMRKANRDYQYSGAYSVANTYRLDIDKDLKNYSDERIGYIVSFYKAVIDKRTNYWSLFDRKTKRRKQEFGFYATNVWQRKYLVDYAKIMTPAEFEARYGVLAGE